MWSLAASVHRTLYETFAMLKKKGKKKLTSLARGDLQLKTSVAVKDIQMTKVYWLEYNAWNFVVMNKT